jgi:hypothetical protein
VSFVAADFNNDNQLDLATANVIGGNVSVLLGNADGTFQPATNSAVVGDPSSFAVGDFDGDRNLDLVALVVNGTTGEQGLNLLIGNGDGAFQAPVRVPFFAEGFGGATSVVSGDLDADGKMDLVVGSGYDLYDYGYAEVLRGDGHGGFTSLGAHWVGLYSDRELAVADLNSDGKPDVIAAHEEHGNVSVLLNNGDGTLDLDSARRYAATPSIRAVAVGNFTGDSVPDLVTVGQSVAVLPGNGNGTFAAPIQHSDSGTLRNAVTVADFNRDGKLDIATANPYSSNISIFRGFGDGTFDAAENFTVGSGTSAVAGDVNNDGTVDAADYVVWRKNGGTLNEYNAWRADFGMSAVPATNQHPFAVTTGDFNGDGWFDVATANSESSVSVLINDQSWPPVPPAVSVSDATVTEGNTGTASATFTLTLSRAAAVDVTVQYATANGSALAGSDYVAGSGTVTIPAGATSRTFTVAIVGDRIAEPTESFSVNLSAPSNAVIADGVGLGKILDNEPRISINDVTKSEGNGKKSTLFTFTVTLSAAYDQSVTTSYRTLDGTATISDNDYVAKTGTLTFAHGETSKTITIEVKADNKREANEAFYVDLFDNSVNSLFSKLRGIGTILNDD